MLNASKIPSGGNTNTYAAMDAGSYPARLVRVVDIGVQPQRAYQGKEKPPVRMIQVTYELSDEFAKDEDGQEMTDNPRWVWEEFPFYSLTSDRAKSTIRYNALDPAHDFGGDWSQLISSPCVVTITREPGRNDPSMFFNNISNVSAMRAKEAEKLPSLVNEPLLFDMDEPNLDVFNKLSERTQNRIKSALNFNGSALQKAIADKAGEVISKAVESKEETPDVPFDVDDTEDTGKDW